MPKPLYHMLAMARNGVIGKNRKLPWSIPSEWRYFIDSTERGIMVMGRICAEEFGQALSGRDMIAISSNPGFQLPGFHIAQSLEEALTTAQQSPQPGPIWICGGTRLYRDTLHLAERLYISHIHADFEGDTFYLSDWQKDFPRELSRQPIRDGDITYDITVYARA